MIEYDDLVESIRLDQVLEELGIPVVEVLRSEYWASCPLGNHADSKPSFSVNEEKLLWNCFTCDEGGPLLTLVMKMNGLSRDEAVEWLLPMSDGDTSTDDGFMKQLGRYLERSDSPPKRVRGASLPYFSISILERLEIAPIALLDKWGVVDPHTADAFNIRYDPERHRLKKGKEYTGPALVIPHFFGGEFVGFQERWLDSDKPDWIPKYTNSDEFPKSETLYNFDQALSYAKAGEPIFVVESAPTVWRLDELAYPAVGTFGASVRPEQIRLLRTLFGGVVLSADNDPDYVNDRGKLVKGAGGKALHKLTEELYDYVPVEIIPSAPKEKGDLADLSDKELCLLIEQRKTVFTVAPRPNR